MGGLMRLSITRMDSQLFVIRQVDICMYAHTCYSYLAIASFQPNRACLHQRGHHNHHAASSLCKASFHFQPRSRPNDRAATDQPGGQGKRTGFFVSSSSLVPGRATKRQGGAGVEWVWMGGWSVAPLCNVGVGVVVVSCSIHIRPQSTHPRIHICISTSTIRSGCLRCCCWLQAA